MDVSEYKLLETLIKTQYDNFEKRSDEIISKATKSVINEVMPKLRTQLEDYLNDTIQKIVNEKSKETVFIVTGEDIDDRGRCSVLRNAVQWSIRSANKSSIVMRTLLTAGTSSVIGAIIALIIKR